MNFDVKKYYFKNRLHLDKFPSKERSLFLDNSILLTERKNKILFREGTFPKGFYYLLKGKIIISQTNEEGKEQIVYIYSDNEAFGYRPLLCQEKHPVTAKLIEDCTIRFIPKETFLRILSTSHYFSNTLLQTLSYEFNIWINKISAFSQKRTLERLSLALLILHELYKKNSTTPHQPITLSRQHLAKFVGTTLETTSRLLKNLKNDNIIELSGKKITILDYKKLTKLIM